MRELDEDIRGALSVGAVVSCISLLPEPIRQFHSLYPEVGIVWRRDRYLSKNAKRFIATLLEGSL